jgi:hypothetical protein
MDSRTAIPRMKKIIKFCKKNEKKVLTIHGSSAIIIKLTAGTGNAAAQINFWIKTF